jgi:hypothetical protein
MRKKAKKKKQSSTKTRSARTKRQGLPEIAAQAPDLQARIQVRAYHIFLNRRGTSGEALGDWLRAERELTS